MPSAVPPSYAVGMIGSAASEVVPVLEKNLQEQDEFLKFTSAWAIAHINPQADAAAGDCLDALIKGLALPDPRVRSEAAQALALLGPKAKGAVPMLTRAARDDDQAVRDAAADALNKIGPPE